jgi:hypothetical protein
MRSLLKPLLLSGSALQLPLQAAAAAVASGLGESSRSVVESTEVATPLNTVIIKLLEQQQVEHQMSTYTLGVFFTVYALVMVYKSDMMEKKMEKDKKEAEEKRILEKKEMQLYQKEAEEKRILEKQEMQVDINMKFGLTSFISVIALLTPFLMKYFEK